MSTNALYLDMDDDRSDEYAFWANALAGNEPELTRGKAETGFWRMRQRDGRIVPIQTWRHGGELAVNYDLKGARVIKPEDEEAWCERIFVYCCRHPVTSEAYEHYLSHGSWPEDVPEIQTPSGSNAPPDVVVSETRAELRAELERWLESIGGTIATQEQADKAGNFADRFADLEKDAKNHHTVIKKPVLEQAREIDGTWQPLIKACGGDKAYAKSLITSFLQAENARRQREAAERAAAGTPAPEQAQPEKKAKAGTRGRAVSLRTRTVGKIEDPVAFASWLAAKGNVDLMEVLQTAANRIAAAQGEAPGIKAVTEEYAA